VVTVVPRHFALGTPSGVHRRTPVTGDLLAFFYGLDFSSETVPWPAEGSKKSGSGDCRSNGIRRGLRLRQSTPLQPCSFLTTGQRARRDAQIRHGSPRSRTELRGRDSGSRRDQRSRAGSRVRISDPESSVPATPLNLASSHPRARLAAFGRVRLRRLLGPRPPTSPALDAHTARSRSRSRVPTSRRTLGMVVRSSSYGTPTASSPRRTLEMVVRSSSYGTPTSSSPRRTLEIVVRRMAPTARSGRRA